MMSCPIPKIREEAIRLVTALIKSPELRIPIPRLGLLDMAMVAASDKAIIDASAHGELIHVLLSHESVREYLQREPSSASRLAAGLAALVDRGASMLAEDVKRLSGAKNDADGSTVETPK